MLNLSRTVWSLVLLAPFTVSGAMYDSSVLGELTGSRTSAAGNIGVAGGISISFAWNITPIAGGYHYRYTVTGTTGGGMGVSHLVLDLSDNCTSSTSGCLSNVFMFGNATSLSSLVFDTATSSNGNPNLPGSIQGVRFFGGGLQLTPMVIEFDSPRVPVYGDFYLKLGQGAPPPNGNGGSAWNIGVANHLSANILDFVVVPDTVASIPEPVGTSVAGLSFVIIAVILRRRRSTANLN